MAQQIPFSAPTGPTNGKDSDGCIHSSLNYVKPTYAYSSSIAQPVGNVFRGNADGSGGVLYEDVTAALATTGGTSATVFDTVDPTSDELWIEVLESDSISGFGLYLDVAGVYDGTATCSVKYKNTAGAWVDASCSLSAQLDSVGMVYITFPKITGSSLAVMDALIDPVNGEQSRRFQVKFDGVSNVSTAPSVDMIFKIFDEEDKVVSDLDSYLVDDINNLPASFDSLQIFAHLGDRTMFACDKPFALLDVTIERERLTPDTKFVYSKADGTFGDMTVISLASEDALRVGEAFTNSTPGTYRDIILPPSDWGDQTVDITGEDYAHTGKWWGIEYTAGSSAPVMAMLLALKCGMFDGTDGIEATETISAAKASINVRNTSTSDAIFVVANLTTGASVNFTLLANEDKAESTGTMAITVGDKLAVQQLSGSEVSVPSDGFITISA